MKLQDSKIIGNEIIKNRQWLYLECKCGQEYKRRYDSVTEQALCCSCASVKRATTHNKTGSKIYAIWNSMIQRCNNSKQAPYKDYGGRGIKICKRWHTFKNFYDDMGNPPKGTSLDRINNNKGYYPENCRWATLTEQNNNKRNTVFVKYKGKITPISILARQYNINTNVLNSRIFRYKWSIEEALTTPVGSRKINKKAA